MNKRLLPKIINISFLQRILDIPVLKTVLEFLVVVLIWLLFEDYWLSFFDTYFLPYLSSVRESLFSNIIFALIAFSILGFIYKYFRKRYYVPISGILYSVLIIIIYCKYRIFGDYISIPNFVCGLGYTDVLVVLYGINVMVWLSAYFPKNEKCDNRDGKNFIPDLPIKNKECDMLDYAPIAGNLAKDIEDIDFDGACSIGLIAPWGLGKTSFLNLLCEKLSDEKFIVIKFNPRHSSSNSSIQKNFFDMLYSTLKEYDSRFSSSFKEYLKAIDVIDNYDIFSKLYNAHKFWNKVNEKEKINTAINRLGKKVVIIIEDFDRLLCDEIIEIFKLIDGNAAFNNMIFITAYDKQQVNTLIGNVYSNERSSFSDKFFTIEIQLPLRPYDRIFNYLLVTLCKQLNANDEERNEYERVLSFNLNILKRYLITLRDVKRFLNLFTRQYLPIKEEVEFRDFLLLYLIKYRYPDEYHNLFGRAYIKSNMIIGKGRYLLNDEMIDANSKNILEILFSKDSKVSYRSINNEAAFDIYFYESVYDGLEIKNMRGLLGTSSIEDVRKNIDSFSGSEIEALMGYLSTFNVLNFENADLFERYVDILIYLYCKGYRLNNLFLNIIIKSSVNDIIEKYKYTLPSYKLLLAKKMGGKYPDYPISAIRDVTIAVVNKEFGNDLIFTHQEMLDIAKSALKDLLLHDRIIGDQHLWMLYSCITDIDPNTKEITLDKKACGEVRRSIKEFPAKYFESFVRLGGESSNPEFNNITCEPFYAQLFGNNIAFEKYIKTLKNTDVSTADRVRNFWELYKNNGYRPIEFDGQGPVQDKIDNDLKSEIAQLKRLLSLQKKFDRYESDRIKYNKDRNLHRQMYHSILEDIKKIPLNIKLKGDMLSQINHLISLL